MYHLFFAGPGWGSVPRFESQGRLGGARGAGGTQRVDRKTRRGGNAVMMRWIQDTSFCMR